MFPISLSYWFASEQDKREPFGPRRRRSLLEAVITILKMTISRGAWVAQSVKRPTSVQVMTSQFVNSSPASGSVLTAQSLEPALDSLSPSLSAPPPLMPCLSLSVKNK